MRNIVTIARKELQSYFSSPIAYVVIGFFALLFGYFFASMASLKTSWPATVTVPSEAGM